MRISRSSPQCYLSYPPAIRFAFLAALVSVSLGTMQPSALADPPIVGSDQRVV